MQSLIGRIATAVSNAAGKPGPPIPYVSSRSGYGSSSSRPDEQIYEAFGSVGTLFAIVTQLGNAFARTNWRLYRKAEGRNTARREEITEHALLTLWNQPNEFYTGRLFRETVQQHLDLVGEGIIVLNMFGSLPFEMWPVRPDRIQPVKHPTKFLTGYIYCGPDGEEVPLTKEQVIHIKYPNPRDPYRGMGPVQTILSDTDAARFSAQWNRNFFINGARPGGVIEVDYRMSDNEFRAFLARWQEQHRGVANAHRVAVLENAKWVDTKFSMQDMQFVELRNLPRELIREAFAFPKPMLGTVDDVNRANSDAAKEIMAEQHTVPRLDRWKDIVNAQLTVRFANGKGIELDYDNPVPPNIEEENKTRESKAKAASLLRTAGWHPDDITEACGLPEMRYVGPATAPDPATKEEKQELENLRRHRELVH